MSAMPLQTQKPLTRTESFQRMLDLEKKCKLARLHSTQTSSPTDTSLDLPPCVQTHSSTHPIPLSPCPGGASTPLWKIDSLPPLSIAIPTSKSRESGNCARQKQEESANATTAASDEHLNSSETPDQAVTQETLEREGSDNDSQYHEDDDRSEQSSICQSPSWEGYDQKKKMKKKQQEADHQKRESDRIGHTRKATANKRSSNRLFKAQPGENVNHAKPRKRLSGASAPVSVESSNTVAVKPGTLKSPSRQAHGLGIRGINESLTSPVPMSTAGLVVDQLPPTQVTVSTEPAHQGDRTLQPKRLSSDEKERREDAIPQSNEKMSYPPPSSRSHTLRNVVLPSHYRRNSASAVSSQTKSSQSQVRPDGNLLVGLTEEAAPRGRLSAGNRETDSYVHRAKTQSVERSIKGFMLEAALSDPGLATRTDNAGLLYLSQLRQQPPLSVYQRPSPTQSEHALNTPHSDEIDGSDSPVSNMAENSSPRLDKAIELSREQIQGQEQASQKPSDDIRMPHEAEQPETSTRLGLPTKDYNLGSKPNSTPSLDTAIPTAGLFSSFKTRISRRGSTSGGSSFASAGRSFKERAMGAMHLPTNSSMALCGKPPADKPSENASQTTIASMSGIRGNATGRSLSSLPKPARLLGELDAETMSQGKARARDRPSEGSSASSYHEGSSAPVSLASTPDTSRPQSVKGSPVGIGETKHGNLGVSTSRQNVATIAPETRLVQDALSTSKTDNTNQDKAEMAQPKTSGSQQPSTEGSSSAANSVVDSPVGEMKSPGPDSLAITAQDSGQATTSLSDGEAYGERQPHATDDTALGCVPSGNVSSGLGILNGPWTQSAAPPRVDGGSFNTILATQNLALAGSQPLTSLATTVRNSSGSMEEKQGMVSILNPDLSGRRPGSQPLSQIPPDEAWVSSDSGGENAQPGSTDSRKGKHTSESAKVSGASGSCLEPVQAFKKPVEALFTAAVAATTATLWDKNETSVSSQQPGDQSSTPAGTISAASAPPNGATGLKSKANTTRPMNFAAHGRGHSAGAIYLQEVRRSAPMISSPLSTVIRNTAKLSSQRGGGSVNNSTPSLCAAERVLPSPSPTLSQFRLPEPAFGPRQPDLVRGSSVSIGSSSISSSSISLSSGGGGRRKTPVLPVPQPNTPLAKMLVECCRCKFFHDMPSRVYECMAQPNAVVTDCDLGVSGAITTMVKCPWCSHNMRTQCCAGYAAVVYLKERLH